MLSKLFSILIGDRFDQSGDTFQPSDDRRTNYVSRLLRDFGENSVTRLSLDETNDGLFVIGANDGVAKNATAGATVAPTAAPAPRNRRRLSGWSASA